MSTNDLFSERQIYTPSGLNRQIRSLLEGEFGLIWLEGEISNLSTPASGHAYFTLKDASAQVRCALFRNRRAGVKLAAGMHIVVRARVSLYEARGEYQLIVESVELAGEGLLRAQFEALKKRLAAEGLFDPAKKRSLPTFPKHLAVVTSPTGAALRDVLSVLERRFPAVRVTVCGSLVQGESAPSALIKALRDAAALVPDVVLMTRGGGSLEDLWAFNDEALARAIAACPVPVVSAVGHEVDFSIADFVADARAATPSAAAELLVPDSAELKRRVEQLTRLLLRRFQSNQAQRQLRLGELADRLGRAQPAARIHRRRERLSELLRRLGQQQQGQLRRYRERIGSLTHRLMQRNPTVAVASDRQHLERLVRRLSQAMSRRLELSARQLDTASRGLQAVSPVAVLNRGYSVTYDSEGAVIRSSTGLKPGQALITRLAEGEVGSTVTEVKREDGQSS
ncbi:MAG: exodeoxyribonuclease VII large subunit [Pseudomonadota bacterium]